MVLLNYAITGLNMVIVGIVLFVFALAIYSSNVLAISATSMIMVGVVLSALGFTYKEERVEQSIAGYSYALLNLRRLVEELNIVDVKPKFYCSEKCSKGPCLVVELIGNGKLINKIPSNRLLLYLSEGDVYLRIDTPYVRDLRELKTVYGDLVTYLRHVGAILGIEVLEIEERGNLVNVFVKRYEKPPYADTPLTDIAIVHMGLGIAEFMGVQCVFNDYTELGDRIRISYRVLRN